MMMVVVVGQEECNSLMDEQLESYRDHLAKYELKADVRHLLRP
jgi:hypothetical protein